MDVLLILHPDAFDERELVSTLGVREISNMAVKTFAKQNQDFSSSSAEIAHAIAFGFEVHREMNEDASILNQREIILTRDRTEVTFKLKGTNGLNISYRNT